MTNEFYVGKIYAWRHFKIENGILKGPSQSYAYDAENIARCGYRNVGSAHPGGKYGFISCGCGFYCYDTLEHCFHNSQHRQFTPALVSISGLITVCDYGYRAENLKVEAVFLQRFSAPKYKKKMAEFYGCKIYSFGGTISKIMDRAEKMGLPNVRKLSNPITKIPASEWLPE